MDDPGDIDWSPQNILMLDNSIEGIELGEHILDVVQGSPINSFEDEDEYHLDSCLETEAAANMSVDISMNNERFVLYFTYFTS